ncbi:hypothetical protein [Phaeobacter sp. B1627]|uniref:hypothetical protein n=1 Tax=Phaeobacter sp. B1627 TaxID=2583809 RepID=UPI00111AC45E|nr:hypothetical protein [Phaeobacter sp. B1627]TNJ48094.1 hypothetical protein FGE21_02185 [Phaeobacter sp. B1627]
MQDQPTNMLRHAQQIAGSPEDHLDTPHLFTTAWATMKAARGQAFDPARLQAAHLVERPAPTPEPTEQVLARTGQKVRRYMAEQNITPRGTHAA